MKYILESERLYFRKFEPADKQLLLELDSSMEVVRYVGANPVESIEQAEKIIENILTQYEETGIGRWCVLEKETNEFVGWAGLKWEKNEINGHWEYYDLGYRFKEKFWGKGYATESAKAILNWAFNTLEVSKVYAMAHSQNLASQRVIEKVGGVRENEFMFNNESHIWYSIEK